MIIYIGLAPLFISLSNTMWTGWGWSSLGSHSRTTIGNVYSHEAESKALLMFYYSLFIYLKYYLEKSCDNLIQLCSFLALPQTVSEIKL